MTSGNMNDNDTTPVNDVSKITTVKHRMFEVICERVNQGVIWDTD